MTNLVLLSLGHQVQGNPRKQIRRMKMLTSQRSPGRSEALLDPFAVVQNLKYFVIYFLQIRTLMDISVCTSFKWTCTFLDFSPCYVLFCAGYFLVGLTLLDGLVQSMPILVCVSLRFYQNMTTLLF